MSGDRQRDDDPDFLDDDFVIEDLGSKGDDLGRLFEPGADPAAPRPAGADDTDDLLFQDHSQGLEPSEQFGAGSGFAEDGRSEWRGDDLDLGEVGVPPADAGVPDPSLAAAEASFTKELDALLHKEEGATDDGERELELVDSPLDGISEIEQSGPFVLDDGDGVWQAEAVDADDAVQAPAAAAAATDPAEPAYAEPTLLEGETPIEPGWEPLPGTTVDQLAEVGDLERVDDDGSEAAAADHELVAAGVAAYEPTVDVGAEIYAEGPAPTLVRTRRPAGAGLWHRFASIAAALLLLVGATAVVLRPEWLGLTLPTAGVEQAVVERPQVRIVVAAPPVPAPQPTVAATEPLAPPSPLPADTTTPPAPVATTPTPMPPDRAQPPVVASADPVANATRDPVVPPAPSPPTPEDVAAPVAVTPPDPPASSSPPAVGWPVAIATAPAPGQPQPTGTRLVRVGDNVMVGDAVEDATKVVHAVDGVLPGTRAFAQLTNGNYFIGSVKMATAERITLRVNDGEVTLAAGDIARLTQLGSSDYEQLQKATSGFIRLTNNNRLVGGILSQIADDHIVLEFRSNRVMLPKSEVGEVVKDTQDDSGIRLDTTHEEDAWLRTLVERQLGTGQGPGSPPAARGTPVTAPAPTLAPANPAIPRRQ